MSIFLFVKNFIIRKLSLDLLIFKAKWRFRNKHNKTLPVILFNQSKVQVGLMSYGPLTVHVSGAVDEKLVIGSYVSISHGVKFILGGNHHTNTFTTFPHSSMTWGLGTEATSKGPITIEDDVWIGTDALILSGVTIGKGAIVAAGSVVVKAVPAFAIVGGNPAKLIRYRFDESLINRMTKIDFEKINWQDLKVNKSLFYSKLTNELLNQIEKTITLNNT